MELFSVTTRDVEKDCHDMTAMLAEKGWVVVNGVVQKVAFSDIPLLNKMFPVEEGSVSLFSSNEDTERWIQTSLAKGQKTYMMMPFVLLAHKTMRFGLSQIAGGTVTGVLRYE